MIYFVKAGDRVKIGYTDTPFKRISSLRTSSPYELEVLLIIEGFYDKEYELHQMFLEFRINGEWFEYSAVIQDFVIDNLKLDRRYEFGFIKDDFKDYEQVLRLRKSQNLSLKGLGEKLGITAQGVKRIQDREQTRAISLKTLEKVATAMGYKLEYRFVKE